LSICACHSWGMALNVGSDISFDNTFGLERDTGEDRGGGGGGIYENLYEKLGFHLIPSGCYFIDMLNRLFRA
jgi:hypothetical protein